MPPVTLDQGPSDPGVCCICCTAAALLLHVLACVSAARRYQFVRFGREGYTAINKTMYSVMTLLKKVRRSFTGLHCPQGLRLGGWGAGGLEGCKQLRGVHWHACHQQWLHSQAWWTPA